MSAFDFDVVVVGGGPAGVCAARELKKQGLSAVVLEARDRLGGRTYTEEFNGVYVDLGGQWVGPTQHYVHKIVKEFNIQLSPQFDAGKHVLELVGKKFTYEGNISDLTAFAKPAGSGTDAGVYTGKQDDRPELDRVWEMLDNLAKTVVVDAPQNTPNAQALDALSVAEWTSKNIVNESTKRLVNWFIGVCLSSDPCQVSLLYFLQFLKAGGYYSALANIHGGAQQDTLVGGAQQISTLMARDVNVRLNCPVVKIDQDANGVTVYYQRKGSDPHQLSSVRAKRCIVAMAPILASRIAFTPALPALRDQLAQRMPTGSVIKFNIIYDRPFWRERGLSGEMISDIGPLALCYDRTYSAVGGGKRHGIVGFIAGSSSQFWTNKTAEERKAAVLEQLVRVLGEDARHPAQFIEHNWLNEEYSRGCYMAIASPAVLANCGRMLREPFGKIHWAGTETASVWIGYIDGALESGVRVVDEVVNAIRTKSNL